MDSRHRPNADDVTTLLRPRFDPSPDAGATYRLLVIEGPDTGASFAIDPCQPLRLLMGKGPACDVRLTDPEVSRRHAAIEVAGQRLRVSDLGSTNGTRVGAVEITEALLCGGEVIRIGSTALRVDRQPEVAAVPLPVARQFGRLFGASTEMRRLYPLCERLAASVVPVIIEGETGTGKELLAESLHEQGPRASGPFIVFDCTAVAPGLAESELFGHERGAFTGAITSHRGVFEQAQGGTLLLDEIGDLHPTLQPKLLRAIERAEVRRVGAETSLPVDMRILAATRRDLDREVQASRFRDDLFHRLAVARVELPPLRRRRGDIALLARSFCKMLGGDEAALPAELLAQWEDGAWPGNVRELRNAVARRLALGDLAPMIEAGRSDAASDAAPAGSLDRFVATQLPFSEARRRLLGEFEQRYVAEMLRRHEGNVTKAAAASHLGRRYFQQLRARKT